KAVRRKLENTHTEELSELRDYFEQQLLNSIPQVEIVGKTELRLPNTCNVLIPGIVGSNLVKHLGEKGICISAGSACKASSFSPSPVVSAMGYPATSSVSAIRVSFG